MSPQNGNPKTYSSFWSLGLVFVTLILLQSFYVWDDFKQRSQIKAASAQLKGLVGQAQTISAAAEAIGRELLAISAGSEEAKKIIAEFKIQINKPPEPGK